MARPCDNVELFVDGELPPEEAEVFRQHLPDCTRCQKQVAELLQLELLGELHATQAAKQEAAESPRPRPAPLWRRPALLLTTALAAALALMVAVRLLPLTRSDVWLEEIPQRPLEARLSYSEADRYRPLGAKMMGSGGSAEKSSQSGMGQLEERNPRAFVAALLVRGDRNRADQALEKLKELEHSPDLENERAVALLLKSRSEEAIRALAGVLKEQPHHPQALWNRGLALRDLGLHLAAARSFAEVASLQEPGWSKEAAQKAETLERVTAERRQRWDAIFKAGRALSDNAPEALPEGFSQAPIARLFFYDAVRAAPTRDQVLALLPLAQELDARTRSKVLEGYVRRIAEADFLQRTPLSQDYAALTREQLTEAQKQRFLAALLESKEDDLLLGALVHMKAVPSHLQLFEAKAATSGDPWFLLLAAQERAKSDKAAGQWSRALQTLLKAREHCLENGLKYRCIQLDLELSILYGKLHQFDESRKHAAEGRQKARESNEWALEQSLLWNLAETARLVKDAPLARAYLEEWLERDRARPETMRKAHQNFADIALRELQVDEARRQIDAALATGLPLSLSGAFTLADIARLKSTPEDEAHVTRVLEEARAKLSPDEQAVATHVLGRFFIERDAARGRALLWRSIEEVEALGSGKDARTRRARAYSFTSLILDAGRRGAFQEALELLEREREQALPHQCLLAATADSERTLLIIRGATGELVGHHDETRRTPLPEQLDGLVPEALLAPLRTCPVVEVLARPPLHGRPGLLPPELAWSYLTRTSALQPRPVGPAIHLVVHDIELPPGSPFEALNPWQPAFGPEERSLRLSGAEATPERVLARMEHATEIDVVAHGVVGSSSPNEPGALSDSANASYLQLAPGQEGSELKVAQVRAASLKGAPFVVLAACHAANTAYSLYEPLSLPAAFISAGARGVLAATTQIPDLEAMAFFNAVRERMRAGTPPAIALRDERVQWLKEDKGKPWLNSVLLFE
jgi:uncharacterized protein YjiS (DUF1127 family)